MAQIHMTEAEATRDFRAVLARVREGDEVFVEQDRRAVAVIRSPPRAERSIDEAIAAAEAYERELGYAPIADSSFERDVQEAIDAHREPLDPPDWD